MASLKMAVNQLSKSPSTMNRWRTSQGGTSNIYINNFSIMAQGNAQDLDVTEFMLGFISKFNNREDDAFKAMNLKQPRVEGFAIGRVVVHDTGIIEAVGVYQLEKHVPAFSIKKHLLIERKPPDQQNAFGEHQRVIMGNTYPVTMGNLVAIPCNSLIFLVKNWVDDKFFDTLTWVLEPPENAEDTLEDIKDALIEIKEDIDAKQRSKGMDDIVSLALQATLQAKTQDRTHRK